MGILLHITTKSCDHEEKYYDPIKVPVRSKITLTDATLWYSFKNISEKNKNNKFIINDQLIILPDGMYNIEDIQKYLIDHYCHIPGTSKNDKHKRCDELPVDFYINRVTLRCEIELKPNTKLDLSLSDFNEIIGHEKTIHASENEHITVSGTKNINITNGLESILIHCSQVYGNRLGSEHSDIIEAYSVKVNRGEQIRINPSKPKYFDIKREEIKEIRMKITDQNNKILDLDNETITYSLYIKAPNE